MTLITKQSQLAHQWLDGLHGLEIGPSSHNPFGLNTRNVGMRDEIYAREQMKLAGTVTPLDIVALADDIPVPSESEDFILSSHVIEHCPNLIKTVIEWYRIIKSGGFIFMITPHRDAAPSDVGRPLTTWHHIAQDYLSNQTADDEPEAGLLGHCHYHVFTIETMREFFSNIFGNRVKLAAWQDIDDKAGNGFTLVYQKVCALADSFPWQINCGSRVADVQQFSRLEKPAASFASPQLLPQAAASGNQQVAMTRSRPAFRDAIRVSAIVSAYNSEKFIRGCLADLLEQSLYEKGELEIVVVDSASPQGECDIVKHFQQQHRKIVYMRTAERETIYQAWNRGIRAARGQFVTNANTDDRHRNDAFEILARELDEHPELGLVYGDVFVTNFENQNFLSHVRCGYHRRPEFSNDIMLSGCHMGPQPMWRKSVHEQIGYFREDLKSAGDYEFWARLALKFPMKHVSQFLGLYLENPVGFVNRDTDLSMRETVAVQRFYANSFPAPARSYTQNCQPAGHLAPGKFVNIGMVTFNRLEFTKQAIDAVVRFTNFPYVLTVVDNHSEDGTQDYLKELKRQGIIKNLLLLEENVGIAKASNLAWQQESEAAYYLKHDNDIVIQKPEWLTNMVAVIDAVPELAALGYNFEPVSYPLETLHGQGIRIKHDANLGGACYLIPKRAEQALGYWCEDYGLYGEEDHDHSVRLRQAGYLNAYMEDEDAGVHLPGGKAGKIDPISCQTADVRESQTHFDYRVWKDNLRSQLKARGGIFERNQRAYAQHTRSLYVPSGVFLGRIEPEIQVFDQGDALLFLPVSGRLSDTGKDRILAWAQQPSLKWNQSEIFDQHGRTFVRIQKTASFRSAREQEVLNLCHDGERLVKADAPAEALVKFDKALELEPSILGAHYARALCLEAMGRLAEAEEALMAELRRQPGHPEARHRLNRIRKQSPSQADRSGGATASAGRNSFKVAVLSYDETQSNCAQLRIVRPLTRHPEVQLDWAIEIKDKKAYLKPGVVEAADVVVVQRLFPTPGTGPLIDQIFALGKPVIYEADDLLIDIPPSNPNYAFAMMCRPSVLDVLSKATGVTASTLELKKALSHFNPNVYVLPNLIDEKLWTQIRPVLPDRIVIGFTGTSTHSEDLGVVEEALWRISDKYGDRLAFTFMGCSRERLSRLMGYTYSEFKTSYESFAMALQTRPMDIAVVPLIDNPFNGCKSNIKWLEYSACGIAGIYSDLPPYNSCIEHGVTGQLVSNTADAWFRALDDLIQDSAKRNAIGMQARRRVLAEYTLANRAHQYVSTYRSLVQAHKGGGPAPSSVREAPGSATDILGVSLERAVEADASLTQVIERVNRYLQQGRNQLASRIVKKELASLPESTDILSRIEESQMASLAR